MHKKNGWWQVTQIRCSPFKVKIRVKKGRKANKPSIRPTHVSDVRAFSSERQIAFYSPYFINPFVDKAVCAWINIVPSRMGDRESEHAHAESNATNLLWRQGFNNPLDARTGGRRRSDNKP